MKSERFKPGQRVPVSGIYRVEHDSHRLMHEATLLHNDVFPRCRECKSDVRFELVRRVTTYRVLPFRSSAILEEFPLREVPKARGFGT
jgi:hypothetical protein